MLAFFRRHIVAGAGLILGPTIYIVGLVLNAIAIKDMGMPVEIWQIIGGMVFFVSVVGILMKWDQDNRHASSNADRGMQPILSSTSLTAPATSEGRRPPNIQRNTQSSERIFIDRVPADIMGALQDKMSIEVDRISAPLIGKWMELSITVADVYPGEYSDTVISYIEREAGFNWRLWFKFDKTWSEQVYVLFRGQPILVSGKIAKVNAYEIEFTECEIIRELK